MARATLSILGLYDWDNTIFDGLTLPGDLDKQALITNIMLQCADLEVRYPTPEVIKPAITAWSVTQQSVWDKLYQTTVVEYNPIYNYDRTEEWTEENNGEHLGNYDGSSSADPTTVVHKQGVFGGSSSSAETARDTTTPGAVSQISVDKSKDSNKSTKTGRAYGNIGVTSTQQMLEQERRIAIFNMYDVIVDSFKESFCIMVY